MEANTIINHIEIPAPDMLKAINFYSRVFGWETEEFQEGYTFFKIGTSGIGGGFDSSLKPAEKGVGCQPVINVDDITETLSRIEEEGGEISLVKTELPGGAGFFAGFKDPNGNYLGLYSEQ